MCVVESGTKKRSRQETRRVNGSFKVVAQKKESRKLIRCQICKNHVRNRQTSDCSSPSSICFCLLFHISEFMMMLSSAQLFLLKITILIDLHHHPILSSCLSRMNGDLRADHHREEWLRVSNHLMDYLQREQTMNFLCRMFFSPTLYLRTWSALTIEKQIVRLTERFVHVFI